MEVCLRAFVALDFLLLHNHAQLLVVDYEHFNGQIVFERRQEIAKNHR